VYETRVKFLVVPRGAAREGVYVCCPVSVLQLNINYDNIFVIT
jgi:hypothetical protein